MKTAWVILIVSALTDAGILTGTALTAAMTATGSATMPNRQTVLLALLGGFVAALRTIQQGLKATPETAAALKGDVSVVNTMTSSKTP